MNYGVSFDFHEQMFKRTNRVKLNHTNKGVIINTIAQFNFQKSSENFISDSRFQ